MRGGADSLLPGGATAPAGMERAGSADEIRLLLPDLVPRAGCLLPLKVPLQPLTTLPLADLCLWSPREA